MKVMAKHGMRGTVALNSDLCARHPEIIAEGNKLGWEWMGHCESNTRRLNEAAPGEEPRIIRDALATIEKATGKRPVGWLGSGLQETWNTLDLLAENGCEYVSDWTNDDQPYLMYARRRPQPRRHALQPRDQRQAGVREVTTARRPSSAR